MLDSSFRTALSELITQLDYHTPEESWPVVVKAKSKTIEVRDAVHPRFVTEMLMGILRGVGKSVEVTRIWKRSRDDVLWDHTKIPWRRSPLWLLLRVGLQTTLMDDDDECHRRYKSFMIFFMAHILELALHKSLPSDIIFIMAAKISRRKLKLDVCDPGLDIQYVQRIVGAAHQELENRWHPIERNTDPLGVIQAWKTSCLSFSKDTSLTILNLRPYLNSIYTRAERTSAAWKFMPHCHLRINNHSTEFPTPLNRLNSYSDQSTRLELKDIETWVRDSLRVWLHTHQSLSKSCTDLAHLIGEYTTVAAGLYEGDAEDISLMLLTTMELWVALDKCVTLQYPLLTKYEPGFPSSLYEPLLLPTKSQMERLTCVEQYIQKRNRESCHNSSLIFQDINESKSLNVQYFELSFPHQERKRKIEAAATIERMKKNDELEKKRQEHRQLLQESQSMSHTDVPRWNGHYEYDVHDRSYCQKCQLKDRADDLEITVHEWPLPYIELEAKSAVFETDVPKPIAEWRETTYALLVDTYSPQGPSSSPDCGKLYLLREFTGLKKYVRCEKGRLQFASEAKPFVVAHYGTKPISLATNGNVCVNHGPHYAMHDSAENRWAKDLLDRCDVQEICTLQLPPGTYATLQYAVRATTHTSNEVLAKAS